MNTILIGDVYCGGFKVRRVCGCYIANFVHKRDRFFSDTPEPIFGNTHDHSLTVLMVVRFTLFYCKAYTKRGEHERSVGRKRSFFSPPLKSNLVEAEKSFNNLVVTIELKT